MDVNGFFFGLKILIGCPMYTRGFVSKENVLVLV